MPHDAFSLVDVLSCEERVTSLTYAGDSVFVGTSKGAIVAYTARARPGPGGRP